MIALKSGAAAADEKGMEPPLPAAGCDSEAKSQPDLAIGGWLWIPACGLVFAPLILIARLAGGIVIVRELAPELFADVRLGFVIGIDVVIILTMLVVGWSFFTKRNNAPRAMVWLLLLTICATIATSFLNASIHNDLELMNERAIVASVLCAAIWIPYFSRSKRVRRTFVRPPRGGPLLPGFLRIARTRAILVFAGAALACWGGVTLWEAHAVQQRNVRRELAGQWRHAEEIPSGRAPLVALVGGASLLLTLWITFPQPPPRGPRGCG